jgi:NADH:ubiquinone oxidoreductase subunit C
MSSTTGLVQKNPSDLPEREKEVVNITTSRLQSRVKLIYAKPKRIKFQVDPANLLEVAGFFKDEVGMEIVASVAGTDLPNDKVIEVVYHLINVTDESLKPIVIGLACRVPRDKPRLPSLIRTFPSANYHERETYEMLGVVFEGHPKLERLLLPEDWTDIPPLRKEYTLPGR